MKKSFIALCSLVLLLAACTEKGPLISLGNAMVTDTTYIVSPVPAADPHNVLAEEFTGQSCPNCPAAHDLLDGLATANPGRLNVLGYYIFNVPQAVPPTGAANDFRDSVAWRIGNDIYGGAPGSGIPVGGIDRVPVSGAISLFSSQWTDAFNQRKTMTDSLNLSVTSTYSATDSSATITATVVYVQQVSTQQNISIAIVEDSITDLQETTSGVDNNYLFTNIFRDMVTAEDGDQLLKNIAVKQPGQAERRIYTYKVNPKWVAKHCRVIAFVNYSGTEPNKDVFQSVQTPLAP